MNEHKRMVKEELEKQIKKQFFNMNKDFDNKITSITKILDSGESSAEKDKLQIEDSEKVNDSDLEKLKEDIKKLEQENEVLEKQN